MMVHSPVPEGMVETVSYWGWPDEYQSWNWAGYEGKMMDVRVFSNCHAVRLELNGKVIAEQPVNDSSKYVIHFKVPYEPGVIRAIALVHGMEVAFKEIRTTGNPANIKLTADRHNITSNRNDLSYVKVEITDDQGNVIPNAEIPVTFEVSGQGEMAGSGNGCPTDMESFNSKIVKTYRGQALTILRPLKGKKSGTIHLKAMADGLKSAEIDVAVQ
jgi:beta-galactosidase